MAKDKKVEFPSEKDLDPQAADTKAQLKQKQAKAPEASKKAPDQLVADNQPADQADNDHASQPDLDAVSKAGAKETAALQKEIDALKAKNDTLEDQYLRAQAEIRNMSNRHKKEQEQLLKYDGQKLAKAVLPAVDNMERALEVEVSDAAGQQLKKGVEMVHQALNSALKDNEITEIEALGQKFDPKLHQAVQTVPKEPDQDSDTVVQVLQRGYLLKDRVLRPAMVIVAQ